MRHIKKLLRMCAVVALTGLALLALPLPTHAHARVSVGIGGPAPVVIAPLPLVAGGYYGYPHRHWRQHHHAWSRW